MDKHVCVWFNNLSRNDVPLAGGKAANLGDLTQAGLPIPLGFVISAQAYREMVENSGLETKLTEIITNSDRNDPAQLKGVEKQIRQLFMHVHISERIYQTVLEYYRSMGNCVPVAVRSSGTAEDLSGASFAGQHETILNVVGEDELINAIRLCWASLYNSQAIFYRHQRGFDGSQVSMAIVVQEMIYSEKAGVTFTVDPVFHNKFHMVIEAVWGLGEAIVSGLVTPDHYKLDRKTYKIIDKYVPEKKIMLGKNNNSSTKTLQVPHDKVSANVLTSDELQRLAYIGNKVEQHFGCPQDIEWSIKDNKIYLLQSRPITSL